jgi:hypothetical protein
LVFFTNGTERIRIRNNGTKINTSLQVGDSTDTARLISALDSTMVGNSSRYITLGKSNDNGNQAEISFNYQSSNSSSNALTFGFYGGEKMRVNNWGSLMVNATYEGYGGSGSKLVVRAFGASEWCAVFQNMSSSSNQCIAFYDASGAKSGGITWGSASTSFNTSSDYRLKKDIIPFTNGLNIVNQLNPVNYKWKTSNIDDTGFIAHEIQEILPHVVEGIKDAIYSDNTINPQSVDYGKLTPILVSAIKELNTTVENLKNEINILKEKLLRNNII